MKERTCLPIGIQLIIFGPLSEDGFALVAQSCSDAGYRFIELPLAAKNIRPSVVRAAMASTSMELRSIHVGFRDLSTDAGLKEKIDYVHAAGAPILISSGIETGTSDSSLKSWAKKIDTLGRVCESEGIRFYHHFFNWDFEGDAFSLKRAIDHLLEHTDPQFVRFNLDLFWAEYAHEDPCGLILSLGQRCDYYHVKNGVVEIGEDGVPHVSFCPLERGIVNISACIEAIRSIHDAPTLVVEQDTPSQPGSEVRDIASSLQWLRKLGV